MSMQAGKQERIRERAYQIWEREGRPHGKESTHWHQAESEEAAERRTAKPAAKRASRKASAPSRSDGATAPKGATTKRSRTAPKRG